MLKVALVTGAASALGQKVCEQLLETGYQVFGSVQGTNDLKDSKIIPIKLDVTSDEDCKKAITYIIKEVGRLDCLINLAGITLTGPTLDFSVDEFKNILDTNVVGAFRLIKFSLPLLKKSKGNVVNITSLNGLLSLPNFGIYSASKHALEALGIALYYELRKEGIKVTNIAPGAIYSPNGKPMLHKPAREKFKLLYYLMPMVTRDQVAHKIVEIIKYNNPPASVIMGNDAKITLILKRLLPGSLWTGLIQSVWNKK